MKAARDTWINPLIALGLCGGVGALFEWLRTPLPWMIGPLLAMAVGNFSGARLRAAPGSRPLGQLIIGTALGLYFTPVVTQQVASYWHLLVFAALFAILVAWACGWFLSRVTDTDRSTAFFASVPGGAAEMAILGERFGARVDRIALAQSMRILIVVVVVPFVLTYSGVHGTDSYSPSPVPFNWPNLIVLFGVSALGGIMLWLARMANPFMFGPLIVAIVLTSNEIQFSSVPTWTSNLGQLLLGCALGSRFESSFLGSQVRYAAAVLVSILASIVLAAILSVGLARLTGLPAASLLLAIAPGGIAEMCITAKVLQLGVPLVTAAHVTRVLVLINATSPVYRLTRYLTTRGGN
ncbi:MAG: AbrB family transcriptional regulator [Candidatus Parcubacteria bacterium]|nr:AbrB family transcriptional regulator [Burkholderiales bacterium]